MAISRSSLFGLSPVSCIFDFLQEEITSQHFPPNGCVANSACSEAGEEGVFSLSIFSQVINSSDLSKSVTLKDMQWAEGLREEHSQQNVA